jgi:hypothetical protein
VISGVIWDNVGIERKIKTSAIHRCPVLSSFQHGRTIKCEKQRYFIILNIFWCTMSEESGKYKIYALLASI